MCCLIVGVSSGGGVCHHSDCVSGSSQVQVCPLDGERVGPVVRVTGVFGVSMATYLVPGTVGTHNLQYGILCHCAAPI